MLVVEDDRTTADTLQLYLEHAGFEVERAADGEQGLRRALAGDVALLVLDLMLPNLDGLTICRELRQGPRASWLPILMLTARAGEDDRIQGLDLGADDYLTKPFSPREVVARVRAILRRSRPDEADGLLVRGALRIDSRRHRVSWDGLPIELTRTELSLLEALARRPDLVLSRPQLIELALGYDFDGDDRTVDAHVKNLRRKLETVTPRLVHTVFGVGYRFALPTEAGD